jgi:hypothetical protein
MRIFVFLMAAYMKIVFCIATVISYTALFPFFAWSQLLNFFDSGHSRRM